MSTLNHIVGQIQSVVWESNPTRRESQCKELEAMLSTRGTELALRQNVEEINDCVSSLSWERNQLGCLFLLYVYSNADSLCCMVCGLCFDLRMPLEHCDGFLSFIFF
jgi:hypothetical protein